jgi:IS5 family transposase
MYGDGLVRMGWGMKQLTLSTVGFERYAKPTRRAAFLAEMERIVPWPALCGLIAPFYPKPGNGRPPVGVERMLRLYFLQQWFNLSDPAVEEALYDSLAMRRFVGIDLGREPVPDETTVCRFRHLLEEHDLGRQLFDEVQRHLADKGLKVATGTIVDATIISAPSSTKNAEKARDPEMQRLKISPIDAIVVDEVERAKNRTKSKVRARVEHSIGIIKAGVRLRQGAHRGLTKNTHRLLVTCTLANLFMARRHLLRCQQA